MKETLPQEVLEKLYAPPQNQDIPFADRNTLTDADGFIFGFPTRCTWLFLAFPVLADLLALSVAAYNSQELDHYYRIGAELQIEFLISLIKKTHIAVWMRKTNLGYVSVSVHSS